MEQRRLLKQISTQAGDKDSDRLSSIAEFRKKYGHLRFTFDQTIQFDKKRFKLIK